MTARQQAFNEIADAYSRARPEYPEPLWRALSAALADRPIPLVAADVGSGTGIASRQLKSALPHWRIIGIEPGTGMRAQAIVDSRGTEIEFREGGAEDLPLESGSVGLVIAAQALHWFDRQRFYSEAGRVLASGGSIGIIQNNRARNLSSFLDDYEDFLEANSPGYLRNCRDFDVAGELNEAGFVGVTLTTTEWTRPMSHELVIESFRSTTKMKAAVEAIGETEAIRHIETLLEHHYPSGHLKIPYISELFTGQHCEDNDG
ncbi:class I SAM-dependent methyltransferase [Candidatus Poriferisodalis sp.]|uniref:class I SAM-dependent methyltransferase n=1 Tax=Candidatus Poriferisodalis sp. TaxID=3101277 RepID=UPI003AF43EFA